MLILSKLYQFAAFPPFSNNFRGVNNGFWVFLDLNNLENENTAAKLSARDLQISNCII